MPRILEVELATAHVDAQREFYGDVLGLEVAASANQLTVRAGDTKLSFVASRRDPGAHHFAFNVPENRIDDARAWLAERAPIARGPRREEVLDFSAWNAHAVYCLDPAGNVVELIARHSLANASDAPFGPRALLEVSEVGVPVDDVPAAVDFLEHDLLVPVWDGDRRGFTALGDDRGLFILVPRGRPWFPTRRSAVTPPRRIVVAGPPRSFTRTPLGAALAIQPV